MRVRASLCERRRIVYENGTFSYENFKIDNTNLNLKTWKQEILIWIWTWIWIQVSNSTLLLFIEQYIKKIIDKHITRGTIISRYISGFTRFEVNSKNESFRNFLRKINLFSLPLNIFLVILQKRFWAYLLW